MNREQTTRATPDPRTQAGFLTSGRPLVSVEPEATIREAAVAMRKENVSSIVVLSEPPSFVTERDLARAVAEDVALDEPVRRIATRAPVWVPPTITVVNAAAVMVGLGLRHLLVLDAEGRPLGVVSIRDVFEVLLRSTDPLGWLNAFDLSLRGVSARYPAW